MSYEQQLCAHLRDALSSRPPRSIVADSDDFDEFLFLLRYFIPEVLSEIHREWKGQGIDEIYVASAQKRSDREVEFAGLVCIVNDQSLTPIHLQLQLAPDATSVAWLDLKLGEQTSRGMRREPYRRAVVNGSMLHVLQRLDSIAWQYHVGFGSRHE